MIVGKSQNVRIVDVFLLGPFLVWQAGRVRQPWVQLALGTAGILTILLNGKNYLAQRALETGEQSAPRAVAAEERGMRGADLP